MPNQVTYTKLWEPTAIAATATTIYTASPASSTGVVKNISAVITNTTSAGITVTVTVAGGTLVNSEVVPGNGRLSLTIPDMNSADTLVATGASTGLTIHCTSGIVIN